METGNQPKNTEPIEETVYLPVLELAKNIEGLDVDAGLNMLSGMQNVYEKALRNQSREISALCENSSFLLENDLKNLIIRVHNLGSSLAAMGYNSLSAKARELEKALKNHNISFCKTHLPNFLVQLEMYNNQLITIFQEVDSKETVVQKEGSIELLKEILERIASALTKFDIHVAKMEMEKISRDRFSDEIDNGIKKLDEALAMYDYDLAMKMVAHIIPQINGSNSD